MMAFTNSSLVSYTKLSPNCNKPRNHEIDTITIHCFVGQVTVERGCEVFAKSSRQASCNYVVGYDGKIGLCVEEKNRSWCTSSKANDHRAITIEVASDTKHPYKVTDKAYAALIELIADICKRNNIKQLLWKGDKSLVGQVDKQNMTVHRWFDNKACPGDYIYARLGKIADEVNKRLGVKEEVKPEVKPTAVNENDVVSIASNATYYNGKNIPSWVKKKRWIVADVNGDRAVLGKSTDGINNIKSAVNTKFLTVVKSTEPEPSKPATFTPYKVRVKMDNLSIWAGAGTNTKRLELIKKGVYTIVEEKKGVGAALWGKLKSGAGWISLDFVEKV
jgi:hypothetical protein